MAEKYGGLCLKAVPADVLAIFREMTGSLSISDSDRLLQQAQDDQQLPSKAILAQLFPGGFPSVPFKGCLWSDTWSRITRKTTEIH